MTKLRRTTRGFWLMKNLVRLSLYGWLVQGMMRKMKEEQGEEDNQRFLVI
jgi:hypothetical protein